jgi:hypothetical protein
VETDRDLEWMGRGVVMASYKDYLSGDIKVTLENLSKAVSTIASAFNKRLRRIASAGYQYQGTESEPYYGPDSIAGVRKFGAKGKSQEELYAEFKRMKAFSSSEVGSLTQMRKFAKEVGIEVERIRSYRKLQAEEKESQPTFEYVKYGMGDEYDSERSESEPEPEPEPEYDFYGMFRGKHLYNYMRRNYGFNISTRFDSDRVLEAAEWITSKHWGELTMDEMAAMLYEQVEEMDVQTKIRRRRERR